VGAGAERVAQRFRRGPHPLMREGRHLRRIRAPISDRLQHPPGTRSQEIGDEAREFDVGFFEQGLEAVLQLDARARELLLATRHRPPEALLWVRNEAEREFLRDQALD